VDGGGCVQQTNVPVCVSWGAATGWSDSPSQHGRPGRERRGPRGAARGCAVGVERCSWELLRFEEDVLSGRNLKRPGLEAALAACRSDEAAGIVVAKLDRLSRSIVDFARLYRVSDRINESSGQRRTTFEPRQVSVCLADDERRPQRPCRTARHDDRPPARRRPRSHLPRPRDTSAPRCLRI
jgi:Resolvase, N terminal domain